MSVDITTLRRSSSSGCTAPVIVLACVVAVIGGVGDTVGAVGAQSTKTPTHAPELKKVEREHEETARGQTDKCARFRSFVDNATRGLGQPPPKQQQQDAAEFSKLARDAKAYSRLASECQSQFPDEKQLARMAVEGDARRSREAQPSRELFFVAPIFMSSNDSDVGYMNMGAMTSPGIRTSLNELAVAGVSGDRQQMKKVYERMLSIAQPSADSNPGDVLMALEGLRQFAQAQGDIPAAMGYVRSALDLLERKFGAGSVQQCPSLWQEASLLVSSNESERAIDASTKCLKMAAPRGDTSLTYASALNNLGVIQHRTGAVSRALESYQHSLAILEKSPAILEKSPAILEPTQMSIARALIRVDLPLLRVHANLGLAYWQIGAVAPAVRHLQIAREQMNKEGQGFVTERGAVAGMAKLAAELDVFLTVDRSARTSLSDAPSVALPMLLERKGLTLDTKAATVKTLAGTPAQLRHYRLLLADRSDLARSASTPVDLDARQQTARELDVQIQELEYVAQLQARQKASAAEAAAAVSPGREQEYFKAMQKELMKRFLELSKHASKHGGRVGGAEQMIEVQQQVAADIAPRFKDVLDGQAKLMDGRGGRENLLQRIQARLPETAALLEIARFRPFNAGASTETERWEPARYGAYLIRPGWTPVFVDYGEADPIDELVTEFRRTLANPRGTLVHDLGRRLDAALMQPLRASLGAATLIYVSPDGLLNLVPFGALVDEKDRYLIETLTFSYLSSGRDLMREGPAAPRGGRAVVIADPTFDGDPRTAASLPGGQSATRAITDQRFDRLPGTAAEARVLTGLLSDPIVLTADRATESALKGVSPPRILHVATHGFFFADQDLSDSLAPGAASLEDPMLRSGLVFAGVNTGRSGTDDGVLTALEAASLDLAGTQLVVLSACETGVGDIKNGEGVFGLRRAFMVAGAETLVMSLWQVDDDATRQLMVEFYRRLETREGRAEALRHASLTLLHDPAHRHPFYWSSFILTGESGPMGR